MTMPISHLQSGKERRKNITLVSACDENYFPLVKGLYLSMIESGALTNNVDLAFLNIGCHHNSIDWLVNNGIAVLELNRNVMGGLADQKYGYRRGQICRAFLPEFLPSASLISWMDPDMWVQDMVGFLSILDSAANHESQIYISQEVHQGFVWPGFTYKDRIDGEASIFSYIYDDGIGHDLSQYPTYNSGFFAMDRSNQIWSSWKREIQRIYIDDYDRLKNGRNFHFGDQASLNYILKDVSGISLIDPLYNYMCMWNPPVRSNDGIVRTTLNPQLPIGVLHLGGGWKRRGGIYLEKNLLYNSGNYLTQADKECLASQSIPR